MESIKKVFGALKGFFFILLEMAMAFYISFSKGGIIKINLRNPGLDLTAC